MADSLESIDRLADKFFAAVMAGDIDTVSTLYADDAVIWKNFEQIENTKAMSLAFLDKISTLFKNVEYKDVRRNVFEGGFAQQHFYSGVNSYDGEPFSFPVSVIVQVRDGKISRIDEYLDSAHRPKRPADF